ncbi:Imm1 family immunity protein [Amycolatopsis thermoflava]
MVTLEVWYNQRPDNDFSEGDPAILIRTPDELDALITQMQQDGKGKPVPPMAECSVSGDPMRGAFYLGVGQDKGFVLFMTPEPAQTTGDTTLTGEVTYDYMAHLREIPASYEVPIEQVRQAARAFLEYEVLPDCS